ncbi:dioxygenase [Rhodospirillaceae bacterium RKSG073]|nr:dioxygenase [Curvivirga aplysinae]
MPVIFLSHGAPSMAIEQDSLGRAFLAGLADQLPKPKAILIASPHWETSDLRLTASSSPETIHDFYGFPPALYQMLYPAKTDQGVVEEIVSLTGAVRDPNRGYDHGAWSPLYLLYPDADIPVIQLSLQSHESPEYLYALGDKLSELRDEGVLIIGSGSVTHNLRDIEWRNPSPSQWAVDFEDWFVSAIEENDHETLLAAREIAPNFNYAHPTDEHWLPLYVAMGAAKEKATLLHRGFEHKNISMAAVRFD